MTPGNVVAIGAAGGLTVWLGRPILGYVVWCAARARRWYDDRHSSEHIAECRAREDLTMHSVQRRDYAQMIADRNAQRLSVLERKAQRMHSELDEFATLCGELAPTAADIQRLRFFNPSDWTA